jgi:hypothetical protein
MKPAVRAGAPYCQSPTNRRTVDQFFCSTYVLSFLWPERPRVEVMCSSRQ